MLEDGETKLNLTPFTKETAVTSAKNRDGMR